MPVFKYRDVSEMKDRWREPGDPRLFQAIAGVWAMAARLTQLRFPPGVHRARSIEASNRLTDEWEAANFRAFHERRRLAAAPASLDEKP